MDVAKDLTAGTVGGIAQLVCGHPFDTIKVKLQSQPTPLPGRPPKYSGAIDAVKTLAAEGPRGLYKGMCGESIWGAEFPKEMPSLPLDERGLLAMNICDRFCLGSHFVITVRPDHHLDSRGMRLNERSEKGEGGALVETNN